MNVLIIINGSAYGTEVNRRGWPSLPGEPSDG
jgi:hypothetical protein